MALNGHTRRRKAKRDDVLQIRWDIPKLASEIVAYRSQQLAIADPRNVIDVVAVSTQVLHAVQLIQISVKQCQIALANRGAHSNFIWRTVKRGVWRKDDSVTSCILIRYLHVLHMIPFKRPVLFLTIKMPNYEIFFCFISLLPTGRPISMKDRCFCWATQTRLYAKSVSHIAKELTGSLINTLWSGSVIALMFIKLYYKL